MTTFNKEKKEIHVEVPLTATSGKIRIKRRSLLNEYGIPVATKQTPLSQDCYVEWQIGYDVVIDDDEKLTQTSLPDARFLGANKKTKALYELSEYIFYFSRWNVFSEKDLVALSKKIEAAPASELFDVHPDLAIKRSHFIEKKLHGLSFLASRIEYPLLVYKFGKFEIVAEIVTREKQRAVGVQPMLYLCFPISELRAKTPLFGRTVATKETADFAFTTNNASILLEMLHLFGMLSESHRRDTLSILRTILQKN